MTAKRRRKRTTTTTTTKVVRVENPEGLPAKAKRQWERVYDSAQARGYSQERAAKQAWGAVKRSYRKVRGRWVRKNPEPRDSSLPTRAIGRPPANLHDAELADLKGHVDRIVLDNGRELRWGPGEAKAYWHPESQSLVAFHGSDRPSTRAGNQGGARAVDAFERWTGRRARRGGTMNVAVPERWVKVARSTVLDYFSTKWPGKGPRYTHDTTTRPTVYRMGGARPPWVWLVRGRGFNLTRNGLIG